MAAATTAVATAAATATGAQRRALVLGATGGLGLAVARSLTAHGWTVTALHRHPDQARVKCADLPVQWIQGDAQRSGDVTAAATGVQVIFHGVSPPQYYNWRETAVPMLAHTIAAAEVSGARIVFPGNIYIYGPDASPLLSETSPANPVSDKGRIRLEMENTLQAAAVERGVRSIIVRAGDFFGEHAPASWMQNVMAKPGAPLTAITYPGDVNVGHAFAYLPDLGETIAQIADRESSLAAFDTFHFGGHYVARGIDFAEAIRRAVGDPSIPIKSLPWTLIWLAQPFVRMFREIYDIRYLWNVDFRLDNRKLVALLGQEPHTPLDEALRTALEGMKCIPKN